MISADNHLCNPQGVVHIFQSFWGISITCIQKKKLHTQNVSAVLGIGIPVMVTSALIDPPCFHSMVKRVNTSV